MKAMTHPTEHAISLYASGDLAWFERWKLERHVRGCERCRSLADRYEAARADLRATAGEMPEGAEWDRLAAEMTANIRLGVAAGECVGPARQIAIRPDRTGWRAAVVLASATLVVLVGWWVNLPKPAPAPSIASTASEVLLEATAAGIELKHQDSALSFRRPGEEPLTVTVSVQGAMRARYVDADTGQVTINHVYAQ